MVNLKKIIITTFIYSLLFSGCTYVIKPENIHSSASHSSGEIFIYGEFHGIKKIKDKELELWGDYYTNHGLRHLFLELPYYTAEFLNIWMQSEDDDILNKIYEDWNGVKHRNPSMKEFYVEIKKLYPETIFHGTDVGHQYRSTGKRYLNYLSQHNMKNSLQYKCTKEAIKQGKYYNRKDDDVYREIMMVANFIREFNMLENESIMGIYGSAHIGINSMNHSNSVPSMANQLHKIYANHLLTNDLSYLKDIPIRTDSIQINGYNYEASYFGSKNMKGFKDFAYREFWRLEGVYNKFKKSPKTGNVLPYNKYPMKIVTGQVFVIDYVKTDSTVAREFHRSDGRSRNNRPVTNEFIIK
ncbi:hypothetical protein ACE1ET_17660 [Saccharicrinis sp. FJH62]|uniref:hypothetical protein n=1 Tax=Saccharicrinis sp. FJH62 TaxID=3344657 RepID=UPI0035D500DD